MHDKEVSRIRPVINRVFIFIIDCFFNQQEKNSGKSPTEKIVRRVRYMIHVKVLILYEN